MNPRELSIVGNLGRTLPTGSARSPRGKTRVRNDGNVSAFRVERNGDREPTGEGTSRKNRVHRSGLSMGTTARVCMQLFRKSTSREDSK